MRLLDRHSDGDHHRTVFTLAGPPGALADALLEGARAAVEEIEIEDGRGQHPHVGAIDVVPVVYLDDGARGAACAEALVVADRIGQELAVPVFLYGALTGDPPRTRAELRRGGAARLAQRMRAGELRPDFGPREPHPGAGATLVAAREPLVAFNLQLEQPATVEDARTIAGLIREGGAEGLPGLRAIGVELERCGRAGVDERRASPARCRWRGWWRRCAGTPRSRARSWSGSRRGRRLTGFPEDVQLVGFDPLRHVIENALSG